MKKFKYSEISLKDIEENSDLVFLAVGDNGEFFVESDIDVKD